MKPVVYSSYWSVSDTAGELWQNYTDFKSFFNLNNDQEIYLLWGSAYQDPQYVALKILDFIEYQNSELVEQTAAIGEVIASLTEGIYTE